MGIVKKRKRFFVEIVTLVMAISVPVKVSAVENDTLPTDAKQQDIVSVELPSLRADEESPFNFIIDPQHLIYETDASAYGGGVVEEGSNLLFHNLEEGEYDFSRYSDKLPVTNRSDVPVKVTISASITDVGDIKIVQDKDFPEDGSPYVYLALVDDEGNEQPVSEEGEVSMSADIAFDTYSFGLTGECSSSADWSNISVHPKVAVTWHVEPVLTEPEEEAEQGEEMETDGEEQLRKNWQEDITGEDMGNKNIKGKDSKDEDAADEDPLNESITDEDAVYREEGSYGVREP